MCVLEMDGSHCSRDFTAEEEEGGNGKDGIGTRATPLHCIQGKLCKTSSLSRCSTVTLLAIDKEHAAAAGGFRALTESGCVLVCVLSGVDPRTEMQPTPMVVTNVLVAAMVLSAVLNGTEGEEPVGPVLNNGVDVRAVWGVSSDGGTVVSKEVGIIAGGEMGAEGEMRVVDTDFVSESGNDAGGEREREAEERAVSVSLASPSS